MKKIVLIPLAFLLTASLILFSLSLIGNSIIAPAMGENGAQVSDTVIREEMSLIRERITKLSELYGFTAEPVIAYVDEETVRELNRQASLWWSSALKEGKAGDDLSWSISDLMEILSSDPALDKAKEEDQTESLILNIAEEVRKSVFRVILPMRQITIRLGLKEAGGIVDLPNLVSFFLGVPWAALALSALLAGLIALLENRNLKKGMIYIGSALGAAAMVLAAVAVLYLCAGILPMIREASQSLTIQYSHVAKGVMILALVLIIVMTAGCVLCLRQRRKDVKAA